MQPLKKGSPFQCLSGIKKRFNPIIGLSLYFNINIMILSFFNAIFLLGMPGTTEMIFILLAILLLFGGKKIPELMRGIGRGVREFKDAKENVKGEIEAGMTDKDKETEIKELKKQLAEKQAS
jgi:sec-independent protein translocase protein TatA